VRKPLEARRKRIEQVYFIESGFASVVANGTSKPSIEVGIIGREGMTGLAIVLGSDRAQHATSYEASLVKLRVIWSTVSDLSHLFDPPGSVAGPEGAWRGRPAGWVDGVQGRPADHLLSVPACVAGHPIPRAP